MFSKQQVAIFVNLIAAAPFYLSYMQIKVKKKQLRTLGMLRLAYITSKY